MHGSNPSFSAESKIQWACPVLVLGLVLSGAGCSRTEESAPEGAAEPEAAAAEPAGEPRVFFVGLEDGGSITRVADLEFGAENFIIEPVGDGFVHEGRGHFHIGIDTQCLPPGTVIPTADPWIHFGDGSNTITMDLAPGEHTLVLQVGDGEHRTLADPGLCHAIEITVEKDP